MAGYHVSCASVVAHVPSSLCPHSDGAPSQELHVAMHSDQSSALEANREAGWGS